MQLNNIILSFPLLSPNAIQVENLKTEKSLNQFCDTKGQYLNVQDAETFGYLHPVLFVVFKHYMQDIYVAYKRNNTYSIGLPYHIYHNGSYNNIVTNAFSNFIESLSVTKYVKDSNYCGCIYDLTYNAKHLMCTYTVEYYKCKWLNFGNNETYLSKQEVFDKYFLFDRYSRLYIDQLYERSSANAIQ